MVNGEEPVADKKNANMKTTFKYLNMGFSSGGHTGHKSIDVRVSFPSLTACWEVSKGYGRGKRVKYIGYDEKKAKLVYENI